MNVCAALVKQPDSLTYAYQTHQIGEDFWCQPKVITLMSGCQNAGEHTLQNVGMTQIFPSSRSFIFKLRQEM